MNLVYIIISIFAGYHLQSIFAKSITVPDDNIVMYLCPNSLI